LLSTSVPEEEEEEEEKHGMDDFDDENSVHSFVEEDTSTLFYALKAANMETVKELLTVHPSLADADFGVDYRFDISSGKKHYVYTGDPDNGFCTSFHVAAESGSKEVILFLHTISADYDIEDFQDKIPRERATGEARDAFLEIGGAKKEPSERYVGDIDPMRGLKNGSGKIIKKLKGYDEDEFVYYEGKFNNDYFHGRGVLYYEGNANNTMKANQEEDLSTSRNYREVSERSSR